MPVNYSIQTLLKQGNKQLETISDSPYLDAELLLAHCLNKTKTYLHTWPEKELDKKQLNCFQNLIAKRLTDYPVAYLLGKKSFWTFELTVTPDVLIPRPETELLVEVALDKIKEIKNPKILDLGTGSGAIALALAYERKDAIITATDQSLKALEVAKSNAETLKLDQQISFIQSDWFERITESSFDSFDLIVSNPPYIDPNDDHLKGTIKYEPQSALVAENKGLSDLEKIIQKSHLFLKTGGWIILEHGFDQAGKTKLLFSQSNHKNIQTHIDLNELNRITLGQL